MSDIQEALEKADNYNPNSVLGKLTKTLAAAYRETKAEADKYYLDLCIKTRTANRERQKHKQLLKEARRLQKKLATVKAERDRRIKQVEELQEQRNYYAEQVKVWVVKYDRLIEVAKSMAQSLKIDCPNTDYESVFLFKELQE